MAKVVVLGSGIAGHTAAALLRKWLGTNDEVTVVLPASCYNWIPSNIWVGFGLLRPDQVKFPLAPVYRRIGIKFKQAKTVALHPKARRLTLNRRWKSNGPKMAAKVSANMCLTTS